jgi:hypothetical protein
MEAALENCHEILGGCRYHHVFPFDEKFHCAVPSEDSFNNPIGRRPYLTDEGTHLYTGYWVSRIKAKISRVFTNFAA